MPRSVEEWIGKTDDSAIPPRVRLRVYERCDGKCHRCLRKLTPADTWIVEHMIAIANGGQNREGNLSITCGWCKPVKDAEDVALKAKGAKIRARHVGLKPDRPSFATNRNSKFKKRMDGTVVLRSTGEPV